MANVTARQAVTQSNTVDLIRTGSDRSSTIDEHFDFSTIRMIIPLSSKAAQGENSPWTVMVNEITTVTNHGLCPKSCINLIIFLCASVLKCAGFLGFHSAGCQKILKKVQNRNKTVT
jgi:hypothetical protein